MLRILMVWLLVSSIALAACGSAAFISTSPTPAAVATVSPSPAPSAPVAASSPSSLPSPVATPAALTVWVGNTAGGGVYLSNSPHVGDRSSSVLAENTPLAVTGELTEGDGQNWYPVKTADGSTGYVPQTYTTRTDPQAPPLPLAPGQTR